MKIIKCDICKEETDSNYMNKPQSVTYRYLGHLVTLEYILTAPLIDPPIVDICKRCHSKAIAKFGEDDEKTH